MRAAPSSAGLLNREVAWFLPFSSLSPRKAVVLHPITSNTSTVYRIHIMGASGVGATALGRATADALAFPHHDTDDYYWLPTTPPYRQKRDIADRLRLMREVFLDRPDWVLSGSLEGWGNPIAPLFDLVVFVEAPTEIRLRRLRDRETRHFGVIAVAPGGWRHWETEEFIEWASHYDDGTRGGRSLLGHLAWLATLKCPVLRVNGARPITASVQDIVRAVRVGTDVHRIRCGAGAEPEARGQANEQSAK